MPARDHQRTGEKLKEASAGRTPLGFDDEGLRAIRPFWLDLPHCDIFSCITPDILHQLHKGMFKDHVTKWATACGSGTEREVDRRFQCMPMHSGELIHFSKGISLISQWTGTEYKNMEKVFLGSIAGATHPDVSLAVRGLLDFVYYARFESHTHTSLDRMHTAWLQFHRNKQAFITHYASAKGLSSNWANFNGIPKLHSMDHYIDSIRLLGTADGYNTELPERLHIDFAKKGYEASNKKEYHKQMVVWLNRKEAFYRFQAYLLWAYPSAFARQVMPSSKDSAPVAPVPSEPTSAGTDSGELTKQLSGFVYRIAKRPAFPSMKSSDVASKFEAPDFSWYLEKYLREEAATAPRAALASLRPIVLSTTTRVAVYKQFKRELPVMTQVSKTPEEDTIHAVPAVVQEVCGFEIEASPSRFSTVLARPGTLSRRAQASTSAGERGGAEFHAAGVHGTSFLGTT